MHKIFKNDWNKLNIQNNVSNDDTWPSRNVAAKELSAILGEHVSTSTLEAWLRQPNCPIPPGRRGKATPIPKQELIIWAQNRPRQHGHPKPGAESSKSGDLKSKLLKEQIKFLKSKNSKLTAESLDAQETYSVIARMVSELKRSLSEELIPKTWELSQTNTLEETYPQAIEILAGILNRCKL